MPVKEAGKKFVQKALQPLFPSSNKIEECLIVLGAFCDEVEKRALTQDDDEVVASFYKLRRELLGD